MKLRNDHEPQSTIIWYNISNAQSEKGADERKKADGQIATSLCRMACAAIGSILAVSVNTTSDAPEWRQGDFARTLYR